MWPLYTKNPDPINPRPAGLIAFVIAIVVFAAIWYILGLIAASVFFAGLSTLIAIVKVILIVYAIIWLLSFLAAVF